MDLLYKAFATLKMSFNVKITKERIADMNKQILIVRKYKGFGGIEHQILSFSKALLNNGWKVFFLTDQPSPFEKTMIESGVSVIIEPFNGHYHTARTIISICKKNNIQVVQAHMLNEDFSCRLAKFLYPKLRHVFRVHTYIDCSRISGLKKNIYHLAAIVTDPWVNMYLPINAVNAKELNTRSKISNKKIRVIHDSVRDLKKSIRDQSNPKNRIIAMIANFEDFKGHDVLLDGVRILKERGEKVSVHLIGGVPGRGTENENTSRLDIVKKTIKDYSIEEEIIIDGYCSDIPEAIKDCGVVVLPSDSEGTPNCLLEGMLLDKIIVATSVGGVPEFVFNGITGFLHEPQNAQAFADALINVYSQSEEELETIKRNAKEYVLKHFMMKSLVNDVIDVYSSLIS